MHKVRNLAYTVNPLPLCLINYIFDFGNLSEENEEVYIKKFVHSTLDNRFSKRNNKNYSNILDLIVKSVHECQSFIRENSEISSVSLRELERFIKFFEFFYKVTIERNEFNEKSDFSFLKDKDKLIFKYAKNKREKLENIIILKTANLCLFMCYYLRIINPDIRKLLAEKMTDLLKFDFLEYPFKLQKELADNIISDKDDKGIAKNKALLDNLFSLFVCLNNKIPVFICGKAGCSKSLSFSLLNESMKGEYSKNNLFQKYPSLYVTSYQGSLTSTSEEIEKIFKNAKKIYNKSKKVAEANNNLKTLSVILFDEMGLAEISPNNPLKVIHSQFDRSKEQEIGFVGISNWTLDASKMNRGIHLSVLEPDLDDLKSTASTISKNIYGEIEDNISYKKMIENLTESYYRYKQYLKKNNLSNYDFHGSRDFYYLIKIASKLLKNNDKSRTLESIALESIERNFGGLESESKEFKKIYYRIINKEEDLFINKCDIFSCIKNNLEDENNRYLLLITEKTKNDTLIEYILKDLNKPYRFIQGSKLKEDQNENYVLEKAWSIISSMEKGDIIILKDIEIIYPKFYDLFNKNLQKFGNDQYARIVLESTTNERHIVDKNFRCIILLEKKDVDEQDPPFLNRFEKHLMSFEYLLNEHQKQIAKELYEEIIELTSIQDNNEDNGNKKSPLLVNINEEEINYLVLDLSKKYKNLESNISSIYELLIPTFTQENFISAMLSSNKKYISNNEILKFYEKNSHTNIFKFLEEIESNKLIIYTFSPHYKDVFTEKNDIQVKNKKLEIFFSKENTIEIIFNEKLTEKMLIYFFKLFYEKIDYNLFIMHFRVKDTKFLKYFKFQLDSFHKKTQQSPNKIFLFIIHIEKNKDIKFNNQKNKDISVQFLQSYQSYFFSFLSEYQQITIDNLLEQRNISITNLYNKSNEELLIEKELLNINDIIIREFSRQMIQMNTEQKMNSIIGELDNLKENGVLDNIIKKIQSSIKNSDNILRKCHINYSNLHEKDIDFISYLKEQIEFVISENVKKLIIELAKNGYLVSYFFEKEIPHKLLNPIFGFINNINLANIVNEKLDNYSLDLKIPGSRYLIDKIVNLANNCKNDYLNKENECRVGKNEINLEKVYNEKRNYVKTNTYNEELLNEDILSEYLHYILTDFFKLFFYDTNLKKPISPKEEEFLVFLYTEKIKDNFNNSISDKIIDFFLWVVCYHDIISKFLEIFNKLDKYFRIEEKNLNITLGHEKQTLLNSIKENFNLFNFPIEKEEIKQSNIEKVNRIFYKIGESICHIITNKNNVDINNINLKDYCTDLNEVSQILTQLNCNLRLRLKGQYSLITITNIIEFFQNNNSDEENYRPLLILLIKNIFDEKQFLLNNNIIQAKEALIEQKEIIINNNLTDELCMKIFIDKLSQFFKIEDYKLELIKVVFGIPKLIKYSSLFFNYIFLSISYFTLINPKMLDPESSDIDRKRRICIKKFGEIKEKDNDKILIEINKEAERNEVLREILLYIFEMIITTYFEEIKKKEFIKNNPELLLTWLNFEYFKKIFDHINGNDYGKLKYIGIIFIFSYLRSYLYHFVKFQLENREADLSEIHNFLFNKSNSDLGKLIILYIAKIFTINGKQKYFLEEYLSERQNHNWKEQSFIFTKLLFFSKINYENSKNLLFVLWSKINNNNLNKDFIEKLEIKDLYYIMNFSFNEMSMKIKENNKEIILEKSVLLSKLKENIEDFNFSKEINEKMEKLFDNISNLEFFESMKSNLKLIFNMIRIYIIGFIGYKKNYLFSLIYSENICDLIKIFFIEDLKDKFQNLENYYTIKLYLEEEYINKDNFFPAYACDKCGKYYFHKEANSFPKSINNCNCNSQYSAIYYDEEQKEYIESGRGSARFSHCNYKGKLLVDYKTYFITEPIINKCTNLKEVLLNSEELNEKSFSQIFINYIFLIQIFIEYKNGIFSEEDKNKEFNDLDLLSKIISLNDAIENYLKTKNINYHYFMNSFCDSYCNLLENNDCLKSKDIFIKFFEELDKQIYTEEKFNDIETNIITSITYDPNFKNENYKYLSTVAKYPNEEELKKEISLYNQNNKDKNPLIMLNIFESLKQKSNDIDNLSHIEIINEFINSFSEAFNNLISRENSKIKTIDYYLNENRSRLNLQENENSSLEIQFENFCKSYEKISLDIGEINSSINRNSLVNEILNDEEIIILNDNKNNQNNDNKIETNRTTINKIYNYLIDIQNNILNQIINNYNEQKVKIKEDIIIKNAVEQINKKISIQSATKGDIFSLNYSKNEIRSFEELFSFYSSKNIFNESNDKIDYSKYSEIKFNLNIIEKELTNNLLTGKKLFSKKQKTYKFYADKYDIEEKTKAFDIFTELYDKEILYENEKRDLNLAVTDLEKIILQNLEILIFYLIKENKYQGNQKISEIKIPEDLYLNKNFIQLLKDSKLTINKLISVYEFIEEKIWEVIIVDRYVSSEFKVNGFWKNHSNYLEKFYEDENKRELKNEMLTSLLIKFICRYLPYGSKKIDKSKNLFEMIIAKNTYLTKKQLIELEKLKTEIDAKVCDAIDITKRLVSKNKLKNEKVVVPKVDKVNNANPPKDKPNDNPIADEHNDDNIDLDDDILDRFN